MRLRGSAKMIITTLQQSGNGRRSMRDLADSADISPRQAQRIIKRLESAGAVRVFRTPGDANRYRIAL